MKNNLKEIQLVGKTSEANVAFLEESMRGFLENLSEIFWTNALMSRKWVFIKKKNTEYILASVVENNKGQFLNKYLGEEIDISCRNG